MAQSAQARALAMNELHHSQYLYTASGSVCPFCTIFLKIPWKSCKLWFAAFLFALDREWGMCYNESIIKEPSVMVFLGF